MKDFCENKNKSLAFLVRNMTYILLAQCKLLNNLDFDDDEFLDLSLMRSLILYDDYGNIVFNQFLTLFLSSF